MPQPIDVAELPLAGPAQQALSELQTLTDAPALNTLTANQLMGERARLSKLSYSDRCSAGGSCRLLTTADATMAVSLPRPSDWELLPAWLEIDSCLGGRWDLLTQAVATRAARKLIDRARLLGLAVAAMGEGAPTSYGWRLPALTSTSSVPRSPLVVDLSALWAGPLCAHLLGLCGADVVKVESTTRPDGARFGEPTFYDLLNHNKRSVALDLAQREGQRRLQALINRADIVIEAARPRALRQMGIDAQRCVASRADLTWISITGYGRDAPGENWVAFGDDAGVAAGLSDVMVRATGTAQFAGDAIADPLTGIHAALAAWRSWLAGGSRLLSLPLVHVAGASLRAEINRHGRDQVERAFARWWQQATSSAPHRGIERRVPHARACPLGADTGAVVNELGLTC